MGMESPAKYGCDLRSQYSEFPAFRCVPKLGSSHAIGINDDAHNQCFFASLVVTKPHRRLRNLIIFLNKGVTTDCMAYLGFHLLFSLGTLRLVNLNLISGFRGFLFVLKLTLRLLNVISAFRFVFQVKLPHAR